MPVLVALSQISAANFEKNQSFCPMSLTFRADYNLLKKQAKPQTKLKRPYYSKRNQSPNLA